MNEYRRHSGSCGQIQNREGHNTDIVVNATGQDNVLAGGAI